MSKIHPCRFRLPFNPGKILLRHGLFLGCGLLLSSLATASDGVTVFEEDFETHLPFEMPGEPWNVSESPEAGTVRVLQDLTDLFGQGTENQILEYRADGVGSPLALWVDQAFEAEVASIRFAFHDSDAPEFSEHSWIILYAGSRSTGNRAQVIPFGNGTLGNSAAYPQNEVNELELVVNNSTKDILYRESYLLKGGETDIWINGELAQAGFSAQNNQRGAVSGFEVNIAGSRRQLLLLDDLVFQSLTPEFIEPEPLIILEDDFNGHFPDSIPGQPWTLVFDGPGAGTIRARADTGNLFGKGSGNNFLEYKKDGTTEAMALRSLGTMEAVVSTFSFRYIESTDFEDFTWLILYAGSRSTANRAQVLNFGQEGHLGGQAARGVVNQVDLVVNNSDEPVTYLDIHTVAPGSVDIWVNGLLVREDLSSQNNRRGPVTGFEFNTSGSRTQTLLIDEMVIRNHPFVTDFVPAENPFALWRAEHFTPAELADESVSGPLADASGDGIVNLVAYALHLNPRTTAARSALPQSEITPQGVALVFRRVKAASDIRYVVEVSGDLINWDSGEDAVEEIGVIDEGETELVTVLDKSGSDPVSRFIRLRLETL